MSSEQKDMLERVLKLGDVVLTQFWSAAIVVDFTPKKVKLASFHHMPGCDPRIGITASQPEKLLILREESFRGTEWEQELTFIRSETGW